MRGKKEGRSKVRPYKKICSKKVERLFVGARIAAGALTTGGAEAACAAGSGFLLLFAGFAD